MGMAQMLLLNPTPNCDHWEMSGCSYGNYYDMGNGNIIGAKTGTDISAPESDADGRRCRPRRQRELTVKLPVGSMHKVPED